MNNNQKRSLARRAAHRQQCHSKHKHADPFNEPITAGTMCAVCNRSRATTRGEVSVGRGSDVIFPACWACAKTAPAIIARVGFAGLKRLVTQNMEAVR